MKQITVTVQHGENFTAENGTDAVTLYLMGP